MIKREDVLRMIDEWLERLDDDEDAIECILLMVKNRVENMPDAIVRGEWIIIHEGIERNLNTWEHVVKRKYFCNRCDYQTGNQGKYFNFCPNCGADMRKKVEE